MLVNNVLRPVASNLLKLPSRATSAVAGARSRHVSIPVSVSHKIVNIFIFLPTDWRLFKFSIEKRSLFHKSKQKIVLKCEQFVGKIWIYSTIIVIKNLCNTKRTIDITSQRQLFKIDTICHFANQIFTFHFYLHRKSRFWSLVCFLSSLPRQPGFCFTWKTTRIRANKKINLQNRMSVLNGASL